MLARESRNGACCQKGNSSARRSTPSLPMPIFPDKSTCLKEEIQAQPSAKACAPAGPMLFPDKRSSCSFAASRSFLPRARVAASPSSACRRSRMRRLRPRPFASCSPPASPRGLHPRRATSIDPMTGTKALQPSRPIRLVRRSQTLRRFGAPMPSGSRAFAKSLHDASPSLLCRKPQLRMRLPMSLPRLSSESKPASVMQFSSSVSTSKRTGRFFVKAAAKF
mmetsp:Transcript_44875/g.62378  ORF Transcript_44875/g.62378 Transcript_44875/m.62378 type:complete len:222 (-) Transcript_44875:19-684(-)